MWLREYILVTKFWCNSNAQNNHIHNFAVILARNYTLLNKDKIVMIKMLVFTTLLETDWRTDKNLGDLKNSKYIKIDINNWYKQFHKNVSWLR